MVVCLTNAAETNKTHIPETPAFPKDPPSNWLTYHLVHPGPGRAEPGDPNPIFDYKGRYHLHYIYANDTAPGASRSGSGRTRGSEPDL
jgi:sucrose-6-phosphate hydrolase SacC (GH32 family)